MAITSNACTLKVTDEQVYGIGRHLHRLQDDGVRSHNSGGARTFTRIQDVREPTFETGPEKLVVDKR